MQVPEDRSLEPRGRTEKAWTELTATLESGAIDGGNSKGQKSEEFELHDGRGVEGKDVRKGGTWPEGDGNGKRMAGCRTAAGGMNVCDLRLLSIPFQVLLKAVPNLQGEQHVKGPI